ncbi:MAG: thioredoxin-like protein [Faunusvirus sp.]|jgi:thiol-disulfide isomerase/thioredoxin|uniref:Thioredoxin-like protein n=1 Tax=Faunusvirus sp. TaxID=2487766 RepID=A0A3G4ZWW4_9VIRU|nr:MAG: thioredoxin-like protein [Faunusvirus sp.]
MTNKPVVILPPLHIADQDDLMNRVREYADRLIVFMFTAEWCGPCKMIKTKIYSSNATCLSSLYKDEVVFMYIDVDACEKLSIMFDIESMPTFVINKVENGKLVKKDRFSGASYESLMGKINTYLAEKN